MTHYVCKSSMPIVGYFQYVAAWQSKFAATKDFDRSFPSGSILICALRMLSRIHEAVHN